jgi:sterol desaturase/sphingolipid hydroxylase (fatty acid hydroxylase superfamily)
MKDKLTKYKLYPQYPSWKQFQHDAFWTTTSVVFAACIEIGLCHLWASGRLPYQKDMWETPITNLAWILLITHWRIPHFYVMHRLMHPWRRKGIPDVGAVLYRWVHSLHHKSYNPTSFSGTSMHPVESTLYFTACLIAVPFGCHPSIPLACIVDLAMAAWLGTRLAWTACFFPPSHEYPCLVLRFQVTTASSGPAPATTFTSCTTSTLIATTVRALQTDGGGGGGRVRECRWHLIGVVACGPGALHVPLDKWFGSYAGSKEDVRKIWASNPAAE